MARLNDAAAPVDPVELLRRKYSRQNKEIARINSTQCVRIRNLENEVSRLLAENLSLHEQIVRLQSEADSRHAKIFAEHVALTKSNLEAKLLEISALVTSLGHRHALSRELPVKEAESSQVSPKKSTNRRDCKNLCTFGEVAELQDGRLPPILEDKSYPRLTLETIEIANIFSDPMVDSTESPEIGPPPVSRFINEEPVKIDLPSRTEVELEEPTGMDPVRSINLEQRRKRRDSSAPSERKRHSRFEPNLNQPEKEVAQNLKAGAKRKMSNRDEDSEALDTNAMEVSSDDFTNRRTVDDQFHAKARVETEKGPSSFPRDVAVAKGVARDRPTSSILANNRKALGPKSSNTDVANSPKKSTKSTNVDDLTFTKKVSIRRDQPRERGRERRNEYTAHQPIVVSTTAVVNINGELEAPANLGLFFPPVSESSAVYAESRDTPPPSELSHGNDGQRPSRRTKASVSYAEPNLRDKMRRPTKELVDAVTGEGKGQRLSAVKLEQDPVAITTKIKEEVDSDNSWKNMPPVALSDMDSKSPTGNRSAARNSVLETVVAQEQRRRSSKRPSEKSELPIDIPDQVISALLSGSKKSSHEPGRDSEQKEASLDEAMAKLDIYEYTGSPPQERNGSKLSAFKEWPTSNTVKQSSLLMHASGQPRQGESSDGEAKGRILSTLSQQKQWMAEMGAAILDADTEDQKARQGMQRSNSQFLPRKGAEKGLRSERVGARRRSMML